MKVCGENHGVCGARDEPSHLRRLFDRLFGPRQGPSSHLCSCRPLPQRGFSRPQQLMYIAATAHFRCCSIKMMTLPGHRMTDHEMAVSWCLTLHPAVICWC